MRVERAFDRWTCIEMTRKMEHIFLTSCDHLTIEQAMRRAELLALGASDELVQSVLATGSATDLRNGAFWRTVWMFLVANESAIDLAQVGPMLDFVQAIRHERVAVETPDGIVLRDPPQPSFSMNGRTVQSMLRLMRDWHRSLGLANGGLMWSPSPLQPMLIEEPSQDPSAAPIVWQLMELTNGAQLRTEGTALHHCVASYADRCWRGASRIWSLRVRRGEKVRHVLTIEVDMKRRAVVQARGWGNRAPSGKLLRLLHDWTVRERVRLAIRVPGSVPAPPTARRTHTRHLREQQSSPIIVALRALITSAFQSRRIAEETMSPNLDRTMTSSLLAAAH
jgi:hypothetical protein